MDRRDFIKGALTVTAASALLPLAGQAETLPQAIVDMLPADWSHDMPPLFCTAYIDPTIAAQKNQEALVAKYPIALVPQDSRLVYQTWRDKVRNLNPSIKLMAYQQVITENIIPGPGHDILRKINNKAGVWVSYPQNSNLITPTAFGGRRVYDARSKVWQDAFLDACEAAYHGDQFEGLFLDNCTIFHLSVPIPSLQQEMTDALSQTLVKLRQRLPSTVIIGNTGDHFSSLNGAMNEDRSRDVSTQGKVRDYQAPVINLYQFITDMKNPDMTKIKAELQQCLTHQSFFGLSHLNDFQHVHWPALFDEVVAAAKHNPPRKMDPLKAQQQ
jgi:hypothetical protein